jgi:hypothetical protein
MPLHLTTRDSFTSKEAIAVGTRQMAVSREAPLVTIGAANCLIIIFHVDGVGGALAHIPPEDEELPAMEKMMDSLSKLGVKANQVEVLIGGGIGREGDASWRQNFMTKLSRLGIQLGNLIDARSSSQTNPKTPIGNRDAEGIRGVVYDPKASQALPLNLGEMHRTKGKSSSVKVFDITPETGIISTAGREGECIIL